MRRLFRACLAASPLALLPACSGASPSSLSLGGPGSSEAGYQGNSSGGGSSGAGSSGGYDATAQEPFPRHDGGGTTDDASPSGSGLDGASDGMPGGDAAPDGGSPGVLCPQGGANNRCAAGETCCVTTSSSFGTTTQTNTCQASTCTGGTPLGCAMQSDCPQSQVCCGTESINPLTFATTYTNVVCATSCASTIGTTRVQFCELNVDSCPSGTKCQTSTVLTGYTVCR